MTSGGFPLSMRKIYPQRKVKRFMEDYKAELKKIGFTGDPDVDQILLGKKTIAIQNRYNEIMAGVEIPKGSGYDHIEEEDEALKVQSLKQSSYDAKMRALQKQRDAMPPTSIVRAAFNMKHADLKLWEEQQRKLEAEKPKVEVMSDEEIIAMAKRRA